MTVCVCMHVSVCVCGADRIVTDDSPIKTTDEQSQEMKYLKKFTRVKVKVV